MPGKHIALAALRHIKGVPNRDEHEHILSAADNSQLEQYQCSNVLTNVHPPLVWTAVHH